MSAIAEDEDERDHAQAMIDWLADKDPDVWFEVTPHLNWDSSDRVLDWIISQPRCDKANAAFVFWAAQPLYYLRRIAAGETSNSEGFVLLDKVLRNWKTSFSTRAELAWPEDRRAAYRDAVAALLGGNDPLAIPDDLLGPFKGRTPNVPDDLRVENNVVLYDLFYGLGTDIGWRPGSPQWREARDPKLRRRAELARQRAAIWHGVADDMGFWWRSLPWMALLAILLIGGAFVLRWMTKAVLF
jgi:Domain of unknown function (DUF4274)